VVVVEVAVVGRRLVEVWWWRRRRFWEKYSRGDWMRSRLGRVRSEEEVVG
jgi:hypothetical protein